ncbi:hypothetical protein RYX36_033827 [Vicia faba]
MCCGCKVADSKQMKMVLLWWRIEEFLQRNVKDDGRPKQRNERIFRSFWW